VLTVQRATVWFTLRASHAPRMVRLVADTVLCLAAAVAVVSFFVHNPGDQLGGVFAVCCLLYLIAPFAIVRHLVLRREIDRETLLGADIRRGRGGHRAAIPRRSRREDHQQFYAQAPGAA